VLLLNGTFNSLLFLDSVSSQLFLDIVSSQLFLDSISNQLFLDSVSSQLFFVSFICQLSLHAVVAVKIFLFDLAQVSHAGSIGHKQLAQVALDKLAVIHFVLDSHFGWSHLLGSLLH